MDMQYSIKIKRQNNFRHQIKITYDPALDGLRTFAQMFHVSDAQDLEKYNSWNFTRPSYWFDFYTSPNTTLLFETLGYKIGVHQPNFVRIPIHSVLEVHKEMKSSMNLLGVQIGTEDELKNTVIWEPATNVDEDRKIAMRDRYSSSTIIVQTNFDFTQ